MNAKEVKKLVEALLEAGVVNKAQCLDAIPAIFDMENAIRNAKDWVAKLIQLHDELSERAADYAVDHPSIFSEPLAEAKDGIVSGVVAVGDRQYRITISDGSPKRADGGNMTQAFLKTLPAEWTSEKLALSVSALKGTTADDLDTYGLVRPKKRVWSIPTENPQG